MKARFKIVVLCLVLLLCHSCFDYPDVYGFRVSFVNQSNRDVFVETNFPKGLITRGGKFDSQPATGKVLKGKGFVLYFNCFDEDFNALDLLSDQFPNGIIDVYEVNIREEHEQKGEHIASLHLSDVNKELTSFSDVDNMKWQFITIKWE